MGWEEPLEKGKATHSSILAWRIPWTIYSPWGHNESDMTEQLSLLLFYDPTDVGNLISGSSAFSKSSLNIWNFMVHILLKPGLENF